MTQQARLPIECLPDDITGMSAYRVSCQNTLQARLPIECLPDDTSGKSAYRVSAG